MAEAQSKTRDAEGLSRDADNPRESLVVRFGADKPLKLDAGVAIAPFQIAYKTYGTLNAARSNAVLVCHALTGDQHFTLPGRGIRPLFTRQGDGLTFRAPR